MGDHSADALRYMQESVKKYNMDYLTDTDAWYLSTSNTMSSPKVRIQPGNPNSFVGMMQDPPEEFPMENPKTELDSIVDEILSEMKPTVVVGKKPKKVKQIQFHQHHVKKRKGFPFPIKRPTQSNVLYSMALKPHEKQVYQPHDGEGGVSIVNHHDYEIRVAIERV